MVEIRSAPDSSNTILVNNFIVFCSEKKNLSRSETEDLAKLFNSNITTYDIKQCRSKLKTKIEHFEGGWKLESFKASLENTLIRIFEAFKIPIDDLTHISVKIASGFDSAGSFKLRNGMEIGSTHVMFSGFCVTSIIDQNGKRLYVEKSQGAPSCRPFFLIPQSETYETLQRISPEYENQILNAFRELKCLTFKEKEIPHLTL